MTDMVGFIRWPTLDEWGQQPIWRSTASEPHSPLLTGQQLRHKSCVSGFWWRAPTALEADCSWKINGITWRLHCLPTNTAQNSLLLLPVSIFVIVFLDVQYCISWHLYILLTITFFHVIWNFFFFFLAGPKCDTVCMLKLMKNLKIFAFRQHFRERSARKNSFTYYWFDLWWNTVKTWRGWNGNKFAMYEKPKRKGKKIQPFFIVHYKCQ